MTLSMVGGAFWTYAIVLCASTFRLGAQVETIMAPNGVAIVCEGEPGDHLYIVKKGSWRCWSRARARAPRWCDDSTPWTTSGKSNCGKTRRARRRCAAAAPWRCCV